MGVQTREKCILLVLEDLAIFVIIINCICFCFHCFLVTSPGVQNKNYQIEGPGEMAVHVGGSENHVGHDEDEVGAVQVEEGIYL